MESWQRGGRSKFSGAQEQKQSGIKLQSWQREAGKFSAENAWYTLKKDVVKEKQQISLMDWQQDKNQEVSKIISFNEIMSAFQGAATRFALDTISDDEVRKSYQRNVERVKMEVKAMITSGQITAEEGAAWCSYMRNELMELHREYTSKFGLAKAVNHKKTGKTFDYLLQKYAQETYSKDYDLLSTGEKNKIFHEIMDASARPHKPITVKVKRLKILGRVTLVASMMLASYDIIHARNKVKEAIKQGMGIGGGIAGGALAGAEVDGFCGPGAPLCALVTVTAGATIGGFIGYYSADMVDDELEELTKWINY